MTFYLLINTKMLISTAVFLLSLAECEIFNTYEYENANISWHFYIYQLRKFQLSTNILADSLVITENRAPRFKIILKINLKFREERQI